MDFLLCCGLVYEYHSVFIRHGNTKIVFMTNTDDLQI